MIRFIFLSSMFSKMQMVTHKTTNLLEHTPTLRFMPVRTPLRYTGRKKVVVPNAGNL